MQIKLGHQNIGQLKNLMGMTYRERTIGNLDRRAGRTLGRSSNVDGFSISLCRMLHLMVMLWVFSVDPLGYGVKEERGPVFPFSPLSLVMEPSGGPRHPP